MKSIKASNLHKCRRVNVIFIRQRMNTAQPTNFRMFCVVIVVCLTKIAAVDIQFTTNFVPINTENSFELPQSCKNKLIRNFLNFSTRSHGVQLRVGNVAHSVWHIITYLLTKCENR